MRVNHVGGVNDSLACLFAFALGEVEGFELCFVEEGGIQQVVTGVTTVLKKIVFVSHDASFELL